MLSIGQQARLASDSGRVWPGVRQSSQHESGGHRAGGHRAGGQCQGALHGHPDLTHATNSPKLQPCLSGEAVSVTL